MAWLRELRLVFGGATPATAAVLAVFMGGLGAGSAFFGRRAETAANPLRLYGLIELDVGLSALLTPLLLDRVRPLYIGTGGIVALGPAPAILLQLLMAILVLMILCLLMGGSLPAAFKWAETDQDRQRGVLGVLYGVNTLGALVGVLGSTFWLLEHWGIRNTIWTAAAINPLIGGTAWAVARLNGALATVAVPPPAATPPPRPSAPTARR
jgi:spermidine synthase